MASRSEPRAPANFGCRIPRAWFCSSAPTAKAWHSPSAPTPSASSLTEYRTYAARPVGWPGVMEKGVWMTSLVVQPIIGCPRRVGYRPRFPLPRLGRGGRDDQSLRGLAGQRAAVRDGGQRTDLRRCVVRHGLCGDGKRPAGDRAGSPARPWSESTWRTDRKTGPGAARLPRTTARRFSGDVSRAPVSALSVAMASSH